MLEVWQRLDSWLEGRRRPLGWLDVFCICSRRRWGEGKLPGQDGGRGREAGVGGPSLDSVLEAVHALNGAGVAGEEVGPSGEYGKEKAFGNAVAKKKSDAGTGEGG